MLGLNRNLTVRFDYGYLRLWGPILTGKSSRRKLRCTIQTGTVIYSEQSSGRVKKITKAAR